MPPKPGFPAATTAPLALSGVTRLITKRAMSNVFKTTRPAIVLTALIKPLMSCSGPLIASKKMTVSSWSVLSMMRTMVVVVGGEGVCVGVRHCQSAINIRSMQSLTSVVAQVPSRGVGHDFEGT